MQLYVIDWSFESSEDQLFATKEFCDYLKKGKFNEFIDGFELNFIAHTPQNGTGVIICRSQKSKTVFNFLKIWRENYNISFNIKPSLTNEELLEIQDADDLWEMD